MVSDLPLVPEVCLLCRECPCEVVMDALLKVAVSTATEVLKQVLRTAKHSGSVEEVANEVTRLLAEYESLLSNY